MRDLGARFASLRSILYNIQLFTQDIRMIDRFDARILSELQKSGRLSWSRLAERINLSASACQRRVEALVEKGVTRRTEDMAARSARGNPSEKTRPAAKSMGVSPLKIDTGSSRASTKTAGCGKRKIAA